MRRTEPVLDLRDQGADTDDLRAKREGGEEKRDERPGRPPAHTDETGGRG